MKKEYVFAIPRNINNLITDARSPYKWEEVGTIILDIDATKNDVIKARKMYNILEEAFCVACRLIGV